LASEEQYEKDAQKRRLSQHNKSPPTPLNTRLVGIKPSPLSPSRSGYNSSGNHKRDSYPAPSESFVLLPHVESSANTPSIIPSTTKSTLSSKRSNRNTLNSSDIATLQATNPIMTTSNSSTGETPPSGWSERLKVANRLFEIMSSKSSVDHPMCQECVDLFIELLREQMNDVSTERDCYIEFLKKVQDSRVTKEEETELAKQVEDVCNYVCVIKCTTDPNESLVENG